MLYGSECWPLKRTDLSQLRRNERSMLQWLCHKKPKNNCSLTTLSGKLGLDELSVVIKQRHLQWMGHVPEVKSMLDQWHHVPKCCWACEERET